LAAAFQLKFALLLLACCLGRESQAITDFDELCRLFKNGTLIRKPATCAEYIECANDRGLFHTCADSMVFDASKQKCVEATASNSVHCSNPCEGLDGLWVADPTDCQNYFYCDAGEPISGHCMGSQHFNESSQSCQYGVDSICVDVANICAILPDKTKFRQEDDCNEYYECKSGQHSLKSCVTTEYFDVESASCLPKAQVKCEAHSKKDVCLNKLKKPRTGLHADDFTCRGYFYCADLGSVPDLNPIWIQCPAGTFFDDELKKCVEPKSVYCTHNRCDGRGTMLVTSSSNNCHDYIKCVDGVEVEKYTCHWDYFFDESVQGCVPNLIYDGCCD
ncbi:hypothetical protein KR222_009261, partial [Zaprionus bogoriensis]